jgi:hypothetical protein
VESVVPTKNWGVLNVNIEKSHDTNLFVFDYLADSKVLRICNDERWRRWHHHGCVDDGSLFWRHYPTLESLALLHLHRTRQWTQSSGCESGDVCIHEQLYHAHADTKSIRNLASQQSHMLYEVVENYEWGEWQNMIIYNGFTMILSYFANIDRLLD